MRVLPMPASPESSTKPVSSDGVPSGPSTPRRRVSCLASSSRPTNNPAAERSKPTAPSMSEWSDTVSWVSAGRTVDTARARSAVAIGAAGSGDAGRAGSGGGPAVAVRVTHPLEGGADRVAVVPGRRGVGQSAREVLGAPLDLGGDEQRVCGDAHGVLLRAVDELCVSGDVSNLMP